MAILAVRDLCKWYASRTLFEHLSITFHEEDRVGLIGPNGAGKTTLLRILVGDEDPDSGAVDRKSEARIGYLPQMDVLPESCSIEDALISATADLRLEPHEPAVRARKLLRRLGFEDPEADAATLSGGWRKRLALGSVLIRDPHFLLMDEPTNHLDLAGIVWLERFLDRAGMPFIVTSHDRYFLERVCDRIVEIDPRYPDGAFSVRGRYSDFLEQREALLQTLDRERRALANEVRREVEWLRRGPKARSSKAGYRIDAAHQKIDQLSEATRQAAGPAKVTLDFNASGRRTHELITGTKLAKTLGGTRLFEELDVHVRRGTRLGIAGNNASGKTTLLKVLGGQMPPDAGTIKHAADLRVALFDQQRAQLDAAVTLRRALAPQGDQISFLGRSTHVAAWAKQFGFHVDQLVMPVGELSGGEKARVLMAMMMREPADVLMLDEPTNDLDIASVEILETALLAFPGAVVLITHDRHMLDRVCTDLIGLHGEGTWGMYADVEQWLDAHRRRQRSREPNDGTAATPAPAERAERKQTPSLTYHEKKEWAGMEAAILDAESDVERLEAQLREANAAADHVRLAQSHEALQAAQDRVDALYARWEALESKRS